MLPSSRVPSQMVRVRFRRFGQPVSPRRLTELFHDRLPFSFVGVEMPESTSLLCISPSVLYQVFGRRQQPFVPKSLTQTPRGFLGRTMIVGPGEKKLYSMSTVVREKWRIFESIKILFFSSVGSRIIIRALEMTIQLLYKFFIYMCTYSFFIVAVCHCFHVLSVIFVSLCLTTITYGIFSYKCVFVVSDNL